MKYVLENNKILIEVSELGATLVKFIDKRTGIDIVLGFDSDEEYLKNSGTNIGASVGRNANRIGNAQFVLNGTTYVLSANDNMNQLHGGGINGFAFKMWKLEELKDDEIVLSYHSSDGEEGFPGNLDVKVSYRLDDDSVIFGYSGISDKDTILNMTNHSYFNLGDKDIMEHYLHITSSKYSPTDEYSLTLDQVLNTEATPYDFSSFRKLEDSLKDLSQGIDNNYVWENFDDKLMAQLRYRDLELNVYSDLPDMHVYTAYYLDTDSGKYGKRYSRYMAVCLECQYYPNGINYGDKYLLPVLKKRQEMSHYIRYELKNI